MKQYTIIGLGRFGFAAGQELIRLGHYVIGIDHREKLVAKAADIFTLAAVSDATSEEALRELDVQNSDTVLVAIGENLEASILCVLTLKQLGVENIWVKASSKAHHIILSKLGVSRVIHPEEEIGVRVAQALNYPMVNQYMFLGHNLYVVEIEIKKCCEGLSILEMLGKAQQYVSVLLLKRQTKTFNHVDLQFTLNYHDSLVLCGPIETLRTLAPRLA
ncbi:potassium channel family protein [Pseudoalteromonas tunicata]|uniref:Putative potassium uptake protein n=1 Tax=Pseudoalteromonas tunicata D2 TaxID=87626 RepID=A4CA12_9GAMM|nr:TrkA family potassium uptake protein [Pseudoalteromonas tunicata]ATC94770.1 trk system potassium uptake protein TrkA [Pseudoalteromonas tunicata]AXT30469.1 TrkA family potassium uptake protein [Pseudoalteromonas tunicata]EAR28220.1 putative potassium uptake protein [Pseudoalteromonas tunicata D2]MDP4984222.1 TrkA family potassium uptake protein [Pseudoalteromonas tunicata]